MRLSCSLGRDGPIRTSQTSWCAAFLASHAAIASAQGLLGAPPNEGQGHAALWPQAGQMLLELGPAQGNLTDSTRSRVAVLYTLQMGWSLRDAFEHSPPIRSAPSTSRARMKDRALALSEGPAPGMRR